MPKVKETLFVSQHKRLRSLDMVARNDPDVSEI